MLSPVLGVFLIGLPPFSPLSEKVRVIELVLVVPVVGHFVLDFVDGGRVLRGCPRRAGAVILFQEPPLVEVNRVVGLVLWVLPVGGAVVGGVGVVRTPFASGDTRVAVLRFPLCASEATALSSAPTAVVVRVVSEWLPPGVAAGYCARLPRTPPRTAAERKMMMWLMALRSSRA